MNLNDCQKKKPLNTLCTFGIGGEAEYYVEVRTLFEMQEAIKLCKQHQLHYFILGKGSNCLFSDQGFNGVIIHNKIDFIQQNDQGLFHVGGGTSFSLLGAQTARKGWTGLEFASGIPASVGGAVFMNAGASGFETCQCLVSVDYIDEEGKLTIFKKEELVFAYRSSSFQNMHGAIVGATFQLTPSSTAREKQLSIVAYRKATQPYNEKSAGCIFCNPLSEGAGALIERCQLKGMQVGGAKVSTLHANFIINTGESKAQDVLELMEKIKEKVYIESNVHLKSEIRLIPHHYKEDK